MEGEAFSYSRYPKEHVLPACGNYLTLKHAITMLGRILDSARSARDLYRIKALAHQCYEATEDTINPPYHAWPSSRPLTRLASPVKRQEASGASTKQAALAACHCQRYLLAKAQKKSHQEGGQDGGGGGGGRPKREREGKGEKGMRRGEERPEEGLEWLGALWSQTRGTQ